MCKQICVAVTTVWINYRIMKSLKPVIYHGVILTRLVMREICLIEKHGVIMTQLVMREKLLNWKAWGNFDPVGNATYTFAPGNAKVKQQTRRLVSYYVDIIYFI